MQNRLPSSDSSADDTTTPNGNDLGDANGQSRVYHHKVKIAGRSQSPSTSNNEDSYGSLDTRYASGPSRDFFGTRALQGLSPSRLF
ncbi:unnamed protein product [Rodentolepis nana]|uniref:Uncharacterized protein n=1 Tax=Rodentolepis nana TaxID=102285 RepID=A0A0R3TGC2_RODNA|nr:unnamed protein product [Rodentolepis nana]